jgi:hypothetical protein
VSRLTRIALGESAKAVCGQPHAVATDMLITLEGAIGPAESLLIKAHVRASTRCPWTTPRFPPSWSIGQHAGCFIVRDADGQAVAHALVRRGEDARDPSCAGPIALDATLLACKLNTLPKGGNVPRRRRRSCAVFGCCCISPSRYQA